MRVEGVGLRFDSEGLAFTVGSKAVGTLPYWFKEFGGWGTEFGVDG